MGLAGVLGGGEEGVVVEPDGRPHPGGRLEGAIEPGRHPAMVPAGQRDHTDADVLRVGQRVVGPEKRNAAAIGGDGRAGVDARAVGDRSDLAVERHGVQILRPVPIPPVVTSRRSDDAAGVGQPSDAGVLVRPGGQIAGSAGAVGGHEVHVLGPIEGPPNVVEPAEERLDLARGLPALVLGVVAGLASPTGERDPAPVGGKDASSTPPGIAHTVRVSPGPSIGITRRRVTAGLVVSSSSWVERNSRCRPSGDHAGAASYGPAVTGTGSPSGPASRRGSRCGWHRHRRC